MHQLNIRQARLSVFREVGSFLSLAESRFDSQDLPTLDRGRCRRRQGLVNFVHPLRLECL